MRWLDIVRLRVRALIRGRAADRDLDDELQAHLQYLFDEYVARGCSASEARERAMREFGGVVRLKEACRDARGVSWITSTVQDIQYGFRLLRRTPGFAVAAIITLALGIGANTAIFTLVNTVLLRLLPVERPHELVFIQVAGTEGRGGSPPYPYFQRVRSEASAFSGMAAFAADELRVEVDGDVEQVYAQVTSGSYFEVLGVRPAAGRLLTMDDEKLQPPVAVISYGYWHRRFGGDARAIGTSIAFGDRTFTIVGVTPPEFWGLQPGRQVELTLPITTARGMLTNAGAWWFETVARLQPGATVEQAVAQADTVFQSFMAEREQSGEARRKHFDHIELSSASRGLDRLRTRFSRPLYALTLVSAIVLLIACVNLGNLLLARGAARTREFAIRLATGAGGGRLVRQLITETCLLFLLGAVAGLLVADIVVRGLTGFFAIGRTPIVLDVDYDWMPAAFAIAVSMMAALVTGLWPAVRASRIDPHAAMKDSDARLVGSRHVTAGGRLLVAIQVALSLILVVGAVIFVKTMVNLRAVDLGFTSSRVVTMSLDPLVRGDGAMAIRRQYWTRVLERVRRLPGVESASLSVLTPLSGRDTGKGITVAGFQPRTEADAIVHLNHVSEDYFRTFGIPLVAGRAFRASDAPAAANVAIVNEAAAKAYFGGHPPVGESIAFGNNVYQVIGVVRDHKHRNAREAAQRFVFVPVWQPVDPITRITLAVSSAQPISAIARTVADQARAVDASTLVSDVIGIEEQIDATMVSERLLSTLASAFAALALGLAAIGLYGVLSYSVACRRSEFGVRLTLGAQPADLTLSVLREIAFELAGAIAVGVAGALMIARAAEGMLFGVAPTEASVYVVSVTTLAIVAAIAAWLPARRAGKIDPMTALRAQ